MPQQPLPLVQRLSRLWRGLRVRTRRGLRRAESRLDHALYAGWQALVDRVEDLAVAQNRLRPAGWRRVGTELASEALSLGLAAGLAAAAFGMPAFALTRGEGVWRSALGLGAPALSLTILDRSGAVIGHRGVDRGRTLPYAEIPPAMIQALVAIEDRRFFRHHGIDPVGTLRAVAANAHADGVVQGGSTLTQQLAKNLFLSGERTVRRKLTEAYLAFWLEGHFSKAEILELYLDRTYLGDGTFGIEAAAQHYFGTPARALSLPQAAMLAGLFKAPSRDAPTRNLPAAQARAAQVVRAMVATGALTEGQAGAALLHPASPARVPASWPDQPRPEYYLDRVEREVADLAARGTLGSGGVLTVRTALDPAVQGEAEQALGAGLDRLGGDDALQGAMVVLDVDGALRALVGGRDYGQSQFDRATQAQRQPGSAFKPFVYTAALLAGYTPDSILRDEPLCIGQWCPQNFGRRYAGPVTLATALKDSINTVAVRLSLVLGEGGDGRRAIIGVARRMGIDSPLKPVWALPLGVETVNLLELTGAYGVFASGGHKATPHAVLAIADGRGETVYRADARTQNPLVIGPPVIAAMDGMLRGVVEDGTGRAARIPGVDVAGKTGTSDDGRDAWFVGFTDRLVAGVWIGRDDDAPVPGLTGGGAPAEIWRAAIAAAQRQVAALPRSTRQDQALRSGPGAAPGLLVTAQAALPPFRYGTAAAWRRDVDGSTGVSFADGVWTLHGR